MIRSVSVIIPARREEFFLTRLLASLAPVSGVEVIVSVPRGDAISARVAATFGVTVVEGEAGRGAQLRAGGEKAGGDALLFCHADAVLPEGWKEGVLSCLAEKGVGGGAFRLRIDTPAFAGRLISLGANWRGRLLGLVYGDQAVFTTRTNYKKIGGFPPLPIMEDVDFVRRLGRIGRFVLLPQEVLVSPRRWEEEGYLFGTVRNAALVFLYLLGVPANRLTAWYRN